MDLAKQTPSLIALIMIVGGMAMIYAMPENQAITNMMMLVLGYYFGSSRGSADKNSAIEKALECRNGK